MLALMNSAPCVSLCLPPQELPEPAAARPPPHMFAWTQYSPPFVFTHDPFFMVLLPAVVRVCAFKRYKMCGWFITNTLLKLMAEAICLTCCNMRPLTAVMVSRYAKSDSQTVVH